MLDNGQLFHVYNWSTIGASMLLALLYGYCLYRVLQSNRIQFALQMCTLLLISNIAQVIVVTSNYKLSSPDNTSHGSFWIFIQSIACMSRDGCFNFAYWLFAFTYLNSAISMPYLFKQIEIPEETERNKSLLFWGVAAINEIFIFVYCLVVFIDNTEIYEKNASLNNS